MLVRGFLLFCVLAGAMVPAFGESVAATPQARPDRAVQTSCLAGEHVHRHTHRSARPAKSRAAASHLLGPAQAAAMEADLRHRLLDRARMAGEGPLMAPPEIVTIPMYVHVVTNGRSGPTRRDVQRQLDVMSAAYGGRLGGADTGIRFRVQSVNYVTNHNWAYDGMRYELSMKRALRRGGPETLNLFITRLPQDVLGLSTYPFWYARRPFADGVVIDWRTMPGGQLRYFNRGFSAVHETGHWLGLFHPFEGGCRGGDYVADTPAEGWPTEGCPLIKDTCAAPGRDPIHNFMDYSYDTCMFEFTRGQGVRMRTAWTGYRQLKILQVRQERPKPQPGVKAAAKP